MKGIRILIPGCEGETAKTMVYLLEGLKYDVCCADLSPNVESEKLHDVLRGKEPDLLLLDGESDLYRRLLESGGWDHSLPVLYFYPDSFRSQLHRDPEECLFIDQSPAGMDIKIRLSIKKFRIENQYRKNVQRSDAILKSLNDAVIATDEEGLVTFMNPAAEAITGWTVREALARKLNEVIRFRSTAKSDFLPDAMRQVLVEGRELLNFHEDKVFSRGGWTSYVEVSISPVRDEKGYVRGAVLILRDITDRKKSEERLRLTSRVFENTIEGVMITDASQKIVSVNPSFTSVTGYYADEVTGLNPRFLKSGRHMETFYKEMWRSLKETGHWQGEIWNRRKNGEIFPAWLNISMVRDEEGRIVNYVGVFTDITSRKEVEEHLSYLASHDSLTEIPNRTLFYDRLEHALSRAHRNDSRLAVLFMDLDTFKGINDGLGHHIGDLLLKSVANRLKMCMRDSDTVARFGGDEFTIILEDLVDRRDAIAVVERILKSLTDPFHLEEHVVYGSASIGVSFYPEHGADGESLIKNADTAMYVAKLEGRNHYRVYDHNNSPGSLKR